MRDADETGANATNAGASRGPTPTSDAARAYLDEVRREIDDEVRRRRASGDLPPNIERELDQLFLAHSPLGGRGAALRDMLRLVDASVFIDPVVPVESRRPGGTTVKRGLRSLSLWYLRYVTHQVSEFATAVSRALHVLDAQVTDLRRKVEALAVPPSLAVRVPWAHNVAAWWVPPVTGELAGHDGRVLHAACGDGWLVGALVARQVDAYGVDPRSSVPGPELDSLDLRVEDVAEHLGAVASGSLHGVVLSGVVGGIGTRRAPPTPRRCRAVLVRRRRAPRPLPDPGELGRRRRAGRSRHGRGPALPPPDLDRASSMTSGSRPPWPKGPTGATTSCTGRRHDGR